VIIDLRGNQGGLASAAGEIGDQMIEAGRIVSYRSREGEDLREATAGARPSVPVAVLVDGETASAAEVLAAALQDHGRATIVGARTFGKGPAQNVFPLPGERGAVRLTVAESLRPAGLSIERYGVSPDPSAAIEANQESWTEWRAALLRYDESITLVLDATAPSAVPHDPVLERALTLLERRRREGDPHDPHAWSLGTWRGVRRTAVDGSEAALTVRVEPLPGAPGQFECHRVEGKTGPYTGFTIRMLDHDSGRWVMLYANSPERGAARLVAELDADGTLGPRSRRVRAARCASFRSDSITAVGDDHSGSRRTVVRRGSCGSSTCWSK
jgi:hypothetical protein